MSREKERLLILEMLKDGTITEDEALRLLDALKSKTRENMSWEDNIKNIFKSVVDSSILIGQKVDTWVTENIDFNITDPDFGKDPLEIVEVENSKDMTNPKITLDDTNASVRVESWPNELIEIRANISSREEINDKEPIKLSRDGDHLRITSNIHNRNSMTRYTIKVPERKLEGLDIKVTNGHITLEDIKAHNGSLKSNNGKISGKDIVVDTLELGSTNGNIMLESLLSINTTIDNINGSIILKNNSIENGIIKTVNGKINIDVYDGINLSSKTVHGSTNIKDLSSSVKNLNSKSSNGSISLTLTRDNTPIKAIVSSKNSSRNMKNSMTSPILTNFITDDDYVTGYSQDYSEDNKHLLVDLKTVNGNIRIN